MFGYYEVIKILAIYYKNSTYAICYEVIVECFSYQLPSLQTFPKKIFI